MAPDHSDCQGKPLDLHPWTEMGWSGVVLLVGPRFQHSQLAAQAQKR